MRNSSNKIKMSVSEALKNQIRYLKECQTLGEKVSSQPRVDLWEKLEKAEKNLMSFYLALQTINETKGNNPRIKERELLIRRLDVLNKTEVKIKKKQSKLGTLFNSFWNKISNKIDIKSAKTKIQSRVDVLTKELEEFNNSHFVTVELLQ